MLHLTYLFVIFGFVLHQSAYAQFEDAVVGGSQLGEMCKLDEHCAPRSSWCNRRINKCECWENFNRKENQCIATIQGLCNSDSDCSSTLSNSYCDTDNKCRCKDTYTPTTDRKECLSSKRLNETCKLDEECRLYLGGYGICGVNLENYSSKICTCVQNYHPANNGTCILNVGMNGRCTNDEQCYTRGEIKLVCNPTTQMCECPYGYSTDDDRNCRGGAEALVQTSIIVVLMVALSKMF